MLNNSSVMISSHPCFIFNAINAASPRKLYNIVTNVNVTNKTSGHLLFVFLPTLKYPYKSVCRSLGTPHNTH